VEVDFDVRVRRVIFGELDGERDGRRDLTR